MLSEIEESAASGEIAKLYADIRASLKVHKVNLIYRYFAATDGVLSTVWPVLRPHFQNGTFAKLAKDNHTLYDTQLTHKELIQNYVPPATVRDSILQIMDFYLTANPMNLYALTLLDNISTASRQRPEGSSPLLSLIDLRREAESRDFSAPADELMFLVSQGVEEIRPTLLRQLEQWPDYLNSIHAYMKANCLDEQFSTQVNAVHDRAKSQIAHMLSPQSTHTELALDSDVKQFCAYFPVILIRMTLLAKALRRAL